MCTRLCMYLYILGCSLLSRCVSWRLPACAGAAGLCWRLAVGVWHGRVVVGGEAAARARDCPKPTLLIRITPIIISLPLSLSLSVFPSVEPPSLPPSLLPHPRIRSLPLPRCSFSGSITTCTKKQNKKHTHRSAHCWFCCQRDLKIYIFIYIYIYQSLFLTPGLQFNSSLFFYRLVCCQGNCLG